MRHEPFDLRALANAAGNSLVARATAKGLRSEVTISSRVPQVALGDAVRLRAALENLIDNAVKFTESGSVALDAQIVRQTRDNHAALDRVRSGIGLSLGDIRKLFQPFSQANLGIAARFGGAGLGLWSVRQIARSMGGDISVATRKGGGSAFTMTVTLDRAAKSGAPRGGYKTRPLRILCVEDNPFGRVVFKAVLTELGHSIVFTERGAQADVWWRKAISTPC